MSALIVGVALLSGVQLQGIVRDPAGLRRALQRARPGQTIQLAPGIYRGGIEIRDLDLDPARPVMVKAQDKQAPPTFVGGDIGLHLANVRGLHLEGLKFVDAQVAALRIERSGARMPSNEIKLIDIAIEGGRGAGIELIGIEDFSIKNLNASAWHADRPAITLRGVARGSIEATTMVGTSGDGIVLDGGSRDVRITRTVIRNLSGIGIRLGNPYVRSERGFQVRGIQIEGCQVIRTGIGIQFDDADGVDLLANTLFDCREAALQFSGSAPQGNRNITLRQSVIATESLTGSLVSVSEGFVDIQKVIFDQNVWYRPGDREASRPDVPWPNRDALIGEDPRFNDPVRNDLSLRSGSPATGRGHTAFRG